MALISISYEIRGTAPRTRFDILHTEEDFEIRMNSLGASFDSDYDEYINPIGGSGTNFGLLS
jgi:hypothetical protein